MSCLASFALPKLLLGLLLAAAMAASGWSHAARQPGADARMAGFLAAGGNPADLCGGTDRRLPHDHENCALCASAASATLPPFARLLRRTEAAPAAAPGAIRSGLPTGSPRHPAWSGRAPPIV
jgi:hypothetical protein